jgi:hypothetical protein
VAQVVECRASKHKTYVKPPLLQKKKKKEMKSVYVEETSTLHVHCSTMHGFQEMRTT